MKKITAIILSITFALLSLTGCGEQKPTVDPIDDNYRVFYQIFVGSFSDSNGDGVGDIRGIINRMDYLNDGDINSGKSLGVQGIWLSPIFRSPSYHKYDTSNYYVIDEKFGTEEDLKELLQICHERNVKVILDLAINHTSVNNLMYMKFADAHKNGYTDSEYYDYYSWAKKDDIPKGRIFRKIAGTADEYYESNFSEDMPELNFDNPAVREEVVNIAKYWLDLGVDGFRFDAVKYIYYGEVQPNVDFWSWYMSELKQINPDIYCVGECWSGEGEILAYTEALNCFDFAMSQAEGQVASGVKSSSLATYLKYVEGYQKKVEDANPDGMMISFLSNHDCDRSAGYMMLANKWTQMAANLYILTPGSPFIYYGEEIAMKGTRGASNTDANRRLAMLWGDDDTVRNPEGTTYEAKKQTNGTVAEQLENPDSPLNYYCRLIGMRNRNREIARGSYTALTYEGRFGGFLIEYGETKSLLFHNTSDEEMTVDISSNELISGTEIGKLSECIGQGTASLDGSRLTIGPFTSVLIK